MTMTPPAAGAKGFGLRLLPLLLLPVLAIAGFYWFDSKPKERTRPTLAAAEPEVATESGAAPADDAPTAPAAKPAQSATPSADKPPSAALKAALAAEPASSALPANVPGDVFDAPETPRPIFQALNYVSFREPFTARLVKSLEELKSEKGPDARAQLMLGINETRFGKSDKALEFYRAALAANHASLRSPHYIGGLAELGANQLHFGAAVTLLSRSPRDQVLKQLEQMREKAVAAGTDVGHLDRILAAFTK